MTNSPETFAHQHWLGYVQPVGLVVSVPALLQAQAYVNRNIAPEHQRLLDCLTDDPNAPPAIADLPRFTQEVLGWEPADLAAWSADNPDHLALEISLPEYHEVLRPTYVVPVFSSQPATDNCQLPTAKWLMLVQQWPRGQDLDRVTAAVDGHWQATPQSRIERLLRETQVPTGLLCNGTELRLVYAPRGESSGYITFRVKEMAEVAGRPIFAALHMLLCSERLFSAAEKQRLPAILADSRKYQNVVSTQLAEQVLAALFELLRGFQSADAQRHGDLLREVLATDPNHVYGGLLNVLMRLVFILYAEDRNLLSSDPVYTNYYSVTGLFERLRVDAGRYPDTMDQRYGAWAQLLTLFRLIYDGGQHDKFHVPPRRGYLFNPDRYPFLEGRQSAVGSGQLGVGSGQLSVGSCKDQGQMTSAVPFVSDGVIFRVLSNLLMLDGERLSYRTLDVEQIGSVYQAVMGFALEVAEGRRSPSSPPRPTAHRRRSTWRPCWRRNRRIESSGWPPSRIRSCPARPPTNSKTPERWKICWPRWRRRSPATSRRTSSPRAR
jgi:hypothetical protein